MRSLKIIIITSLIILAIPVFGESNKIKSINVTDWKLLYDHDISLESVALKSGWKPVEIPLSFKYPHPRVEDFQYLWLKGEFIISDDPAEYFGICMGRVYHTDRVYINNKLIGSRSPEEINTLHSPRNYIIPGGVLKKGKNEIYINLGIFGNEYGGILSDVFILSKYLFLEEQDWDFLIFKQIPFAMVVYISSLVVLLIILVIIFNLIGKSYIYTIEMSFVYNILLFLLAIFGIIIMFFPFEPDFPENIFLIQSAGLSVAIPFITVILLLFIQSLYGVYLSGFNKTVIPVFLIITIVNLFYRSIVFNFYISDILIWFTLCFSLICYILLFYRLKIPRPDRFKLSILIMVITLNMVTWIWEIISYYAGTCAVGILATFSIPFFAIFLMVLYAGEIYRRWVDLGYLYDRLMLKEKSSSSEDTLSITDASEEKLKRVIDFIDKNYTSDISREGLAAAVDMHPNYMGSLFKNYAGKTINEYINSLRIEDAIRQLESENSRIIDIAFSVGYESLATFNRVFKKVTGKTPSEYKNYN